MSLVPALFEAIRAGDLAEALKILEAEPGLVRAPHPDPDAWDQVSPLHAAAKFGRLEIVRALVERGAEVYSHPFSTYPAVTVADWEGHAEIVRYFLDEIPEKAEGTNGLGVTINLAGRQGWTEIVRKHLEIDPLAVHQRGWIGDTPLHWPAHNGHVEIVRMLLEAGADPNAHVLHWVGGTPLHWASERAPENLRLLLEFGADVHARVKLAGSSMEGATALIWCAKQRDDCAEAARVLLEAGVEADARDAEGKTALDHAHGNAPTVARLLEGK